MLRLPCLERIHCNRRAARLCLFRLSPVNERIVISGEIAIPTSRASLSFSASSFRRRSSRSVMSIASWSRKCETRVNVIAIPIFSSPCDANQHIARNLGLSMRIHTTVCSSPRRCSSSSSSREPSVGSSSNSGSTSGYSSGYRTSNVTFTVKT